jgi:phage terminase small subunit
MATKDTLSIKQEKWAMAYLDTGNASEAYRLAYDCKNMKPESINRKAKEMLDNGKIMAFVQELKEALDFSPENIKRKYAKAWKSAENKDDPNAMRAIAADMAKVAGMFNEERGESQGAQIGALLTELERERKAKEPNVVPLRVVGNETGS